MDIADTQAHLALAYVATASDNGHRLTTREFRDYMANPQRIRRTQTPAVLGLALGNQIAEMAKLFGGTTTTEELLEYLRRVHWVIVDSDTVLITRLGRAILRSLERQAIDDETPIDVVLNDELSYARMIGTIASAGPAALAEPYFQIEQLLAIVQQTEVERVLTHPDRASGRGRIAALTTGLAAVNADRPFEIRCSDAIHDRFLIPNTGTVRSIGSSLNHLGRRFSVSVVLGDELAASVRDFFEREWSAATPIQPPALPVAAKPAKTAGGKAKATSSRQPRKRQSSATRKPSTKRKPPSK